MKTEVRRIQDQLRRAFEGGAWHGPSLSEILNRVKVSEVDSRPFPETHTIRELLTHILVWEEEAIERLKGGGHRDLPPERDWPDGETWAELLRRAVEVHRTLLTTVGELEDSRLEDEVPGDPPSVYHLLHGIVQHNLYHAGQIALLAKALS